MSKKKLYNFFNDEGKVIHLQSNKILELENKNKVWLVISGRLDLFFVERDNSGNHISSRNHIITCDTGQFFFNLNSIAESNDLSIIGIGLNTEILEVSDMKFKKFISTGDPNKYLIDMFNKWTLELTKFIGLETSPRAVSYTHLTLPTICTV